MQINTKQTFNKHSVISIALLNHAINPDLLQTLSTRLKEKFAYFEILLLNPTIEYNSMSHTQIKALPPPPPQLL